PSSGIGGGNFRRKVWFHREKTTRVALLKRLVGEFFCGGGGVGPWVQAMSLDIKGRLILIGY
ncbi:hypothetical protein HAX54_009852, partial [Datura stramonium]|nr:hypothetical protein [Datura stramonium]